MKVNSFLHFSKYRINVMPCNHVNQMNKRYITRATLVSYKNNDDDSDDENEIKKKQNENKKNQESIYAQKVVQLNKLFYLDYTLTSEELEDLIMGTFKKLYKITLEVINENVCLVVYPEVKPVNDLKYKEDLIIISELLSDLAVKQYLYDEFKKADILKKDRYILPLPIKNIF